MNKNRTSQIIGASVEILILLCLVVMFLAGTETSSELSGHRAAMKEEAQNTSRLGSYLGDARERSLGVAAARRASA